VELEVVSSRRTPFHANEAIQGRACNFGGFRGREAASRGEDPFAVSINDLYAEEGAALFLIFFNFSIYIFFWGVVLICVFADFVHTGLERPPRSQASNLPGKLISICRPSNLAHVSVLPSDLPGFFSHSCFGRADYPDRQMSIPALMPSKFVGESHDCNKIMLQHLWPLCLLPIHSALQGPRSLKPAC
jgi:hypothetical protein